MGQFSAWWFCKWKARKENKPLAPDNASWPGSRAGCNKRGGVLYCRQLDWMGPRSVSMTAYARRRCDPRARQVTSKTGKKLESNNSELDRSSESMRKNDFLRFPKHRLCWCRGTVTLLLISPFWALHCYLATCQDDEIPAIMKSCKPKCKPKYNQNCEWVVVVVVVGK